MSDAAVSRIDWSVPLPRTVHASAVALAGQGLLIIGASGSGKSTLAMQLIGLGAGLVSDDLVELTANGSTLRLDCPVSCESARAIEARGLGLLGAPLAGPVALGFVVDMGRTATRRMPEPEHIVISNTHIPLFSRVDSPAFPEMLAHLMRYGQWTL